MVSACTQNQNHHLVHHLMFGWINGGRGGLQQLLMEATPKPNECLINKSDSMVMLMETAVSGKPHQVCEISSTQGIIVPLWTGFAEASTPDRDSWTYANLSKHAREAIDLGAVTSVVKVDGVPVAKLDVDSSMRSGSLVYKINSMDNVTEVLSKGFNITIPENTHLSRSESRNMAIWSSWMVRLPETITIR